MTEPETHRPPSRSARSEPGPHSDDPIRSARSREALGQLAGGIAISLNDFLSATLAHLDLLEEGLSPEERERVGHDLREIRRTATTSAQMVKHLLSVSRGERIRLQSVSLAEVVEEALGLIRPIVPPTVTLATRVDPLEPVLADSPAVEQILLTLATNALEAMPDGGRLEIEAGRGGFDQEHLERTGWGDPGEYGMVVVRDTGRGMSPEVVSRLFQPFTSTGDRDPGLSMAVVYGLMKQHRGFIQVESAPDRGTTVRLFFRRAPTRGDAPTASTAGEAAAGATVLFVEDDDSLRRVTGRILRSRGYRVLEAPNGLEALEVMEREGTPDLLLADLIMPGMSGAELLERLEREGRLPRVLLTSGFDPEFLMGWDRVDPSTLPFLEKPWQIEALLTRVGEALRGGGG